MNKQTNKRTVQKQKTKHNTVRSVIVDEHSLAAAIRQHLEIKNTSMRRQPMTFRSVKQNS
ncbi:hypothetical protein [Aeromonas veronii]|uniref:hypothetical protein n=1 Tax=Aeromonas veronii TaxID=654 RepID=UPI002B497356|nr:hypothetical protein [Aeromonas veronii]